MGFNALVGLLPTSAALYELPIIPGLCPQKTANIRLLLLLIIIREDNLTHKLPLLVLLPTSAVLIVKTPRRYFGRRYQSLNTVAFFMDSVLEREAWGR